LNLTPSSPTIPAPAQPELVAETFLGVLIRRARYVVAILLSAWLFGVIGWQFAMPPADWGGVSPLVWGTSPLHVMAWSQIAVLMGLLVIAAVLASLLVHPDTPHMGLCCALMGMAALSIRGGSIYMLVRHAEAEGTYSRTFQLLAIETVIWCSVLITAERIVRALHGRFLLANTRWLTRSGVDLVKAQQIEGGMAYGIAKRLGTLKLPRIITIVLACLVNATVGGLLLFLVLQVQLKGQVLFGCFAAFFISTLLAYFAFPRVPAVTFFLSVPIAAAVGYWLTACHPIAYPGHAGLYLGNALPIDYISTGIPGAIFGYYMALHWNLQSRMPES